MSAKPIPVPGIWNLFAIEQTGWSSVKKPVASYTGTDHTSWSVLEEWMEEGGRFGTADSKQLSWEYREYLDGVPSARTEVLIYLETPHGGQEHLFEIFFIPSGEQVTCILWAPSGPIPGTSIIEPPYSAMFRPAYSRDYYPDSFPVQMENLMPVPEAEFDKYQAVWDDRNLTAGKELEEPSAQELAEMLERTRTTLQRASELEAKSGGGFERRKLQNEVMELLKRRRAYLGVEPLPYDPWELEEAPLIPIGEMFQPGGSH